jgi:hypothetical protein
LEKRWSCQEHITRWQSPHFVSQGGQGTWTLLGKGWEWKGEGSHSGLGHQGPQPWLSKCDVNCIIFNSLFLFNVCHLDILMLVLDHHGLQRITPKTNWSFHSNFLGGDA